MKVGKRPKATKSKTTDLFALLSRKKSIEDDESVDLTVSTDKKSVARKGAETRLRSEINLKLKSVDQVEFARSA
jgi:hypothetical protein